MLRVPRPQIWLIACAVFVTASRARADDPAPENQASLCAQNYKLDSQGSDDSLRNSSVLAMQALMDLSNLHLVNAVKNGYGAYGKYRTAENFDRLKDQSAQCANRLASIGAGQQLPEGPTNTTFRRLDPAFLSQGEASTVSGEFERATGMKRGEFLTQLSNVSEQKIKRSDPAMIDKALSRFEGFLQKIPNADFKKGAEKGIAMVPDTVRRGMVASAVTKLAGFFAGSPGPAPQLDSTITSMNGSKLANGTGAAPAGTGASAVAGGDTGAAAADASKGTDTNRDPASASAGAAAADAAKAANASAGNKNGVEGVVAAALLESRGQNQSDNASGAGELTIFQQVTKRIRILTPELTKAL
jgi:hypothetical protein